MKARATPRLDENVGDSGFDLESRGELSARGVGKGDAPNISRALRGQFPMMEERRGLRITTWNGKPGLTQTRGSKLMRSSERNQVSHKCVQLLNADKIFVILEHMED